MRILTYVVVWCERGDNRYPLADYSEVNHVNLIKRFIEKEAQPFSQALHT